MKLLEKLQEIRGLKDEREVSAVQKLLAFLMIAV
jgi:hypothetical protein